MRFFAVVLAFAALIMPIFAATLPVEARSLEARSMAPCTRAQVDDERCAPRDNKVEKCMLTENGIFWITIRQCALYEFCDDEPWGIPYCRNFGTLGSFGCFFGCKLVDGKYVDMNETDVEVAKVEGAKVEHPKAELPPPANSNTATPDTDNEPAANTDTDVTPAADPSKRGVPDGEKFSIDPCEAWQQFETRCHRANNGRIDICDWSDEFHGYRWLVLTWCQVHQYCEEIAPGQPRCKNFGYTPQPSCLFGCKQVDGKHVAMNATEIAGMKAAPAKVDAN